MSTGKSSTSSSLSAWKSLLSSVASFRGDLSSLTAPPFILSPTSQLEYTQYWYPGHDLFVDPATEEDPEQRFIKVVKWAIACHRAHYTQRNVSEGYEKKPLNPFLGELFTGKWQNSEATVRAEQVSHHPPVSAFKISTKEGVEAEGYVGVKAKFSGSIKVKQVGHTVYTLKDRNEIYCMGLPSLHIEGFLTGAPYIELDGENFVTSTTGYRATISYSGAGYFSGQKHSIKVVIFKESDPSKILYTIKGQWHKVMIIKNEATGAESQFLDLSKVTQPPELFVVDIDKQHPLESRRAWEKVAAAIRKGDYDEITREKSKIENEQREMRKAEGAEGKSWDRRWFGAYKHSEDQHKELLPHTNEEIWRFHEERWEADEDFQKRHIE